MPFELWDFVTIAAFGAGIERNTKNTKSKTMQMRIYYEDTDCGGIVYHANYLKFCERARSELFFAQGEEPHDAEGSFVVRKMEARFSLPARLGDSIEVRTRLIESKAASLILEQEVFRTFDARLRLSVWESVFVMQVQLAYISAQGKPCKIPTRKLEVITSALTSQTHTKGAPCDPKNPK